jgi:DNA repair exonuclease SbcCD ATPase subunit
MATLTGLENEFQKIQGDLSTYEQQKDLAINELKSVKLDIKDLKSNIRVLNNRISALNTVIDVETDDITRARLEVERDEAQKNLQANIDERTRLSELVKNKTDAQKNIDEATEKLNKIIADFASDPRINAHLVEAFEISYDNAIDSTEKEKSELESISEKLSLDFKNEKVFAPLVRNLVESYSEFKKLPAFILDAETEKKAEDIKAQLKNNQDALISAISSRAEYANIHFSVEDLEAIVAGPKDEKYEIPTLAEEIENKGKISEELTAKKEKLVEYVKSLRVAEKVDDEEINTKLEENDTKYKTAESKEQTEQAEVDRIAKEIEDLKAAFTSTTATQENQDKLAQLKLEISDLETKLGALGINQSELDELINKVNIPEELTKREENAQKEYDKVVEALKNKGYIGKSLYPDLADENSDVSKKFAEFRDADKAVRQAFLACQTSSDDQKSKEDLKKAMENYRKVSGELTAIPGMEGLTVENWHNYLVRTLENEQDNGEVLGEEYFEGTMDSKLSAIKSTYRKEFSKNEHTVSDKYDDVQGISKELRDIQESFLKGEKDDDGNDVVTYDSAASVVDNYRAKFNDLFEGLKNAGAIGLERIEDLFGKIAGKITKIGFLNRIKNFFTRNRASQDIIGGMNEEEKDEISDLTSSLRTKKADLEDAKTDVKDARYSRLSNEEASKLDELEAKVEERDELIDIRTQKETKMKELEDKINNSQKAATPEEKAKLDKLEEDRKAHQNELEAAMQEKETLSQERKTLEEQKANLKAYIPDVVKGAKGIAHGQAQGLKEATEKSVIKHFDDEEGR